MKLLRNAQTLLRRPRLAGEYFRYLLGRAQHGGEAVRTFPRDRFQIGGLSGFSEFHSCARAINATERQFLTEFPFGVGAIIDVGGNLGIFSLLMARRFPEREIHAFEPNPATFEAMRANFARNHCGNVHAYAQAVAAHTGEIAFQADPVDRATNHIISNESAPTDGSPLARVPCVTLDSFVEARQISPISLLKVDVEGFEELVFRGAERLLTRHWLRTIYYEVCPKLTLRAGFAPDAASKRLLARGYQLHALRDDGQLHPVDVARISDVKLENWVASC